VSKGKHGGPRPGSGQKPFVADVTAEDALEFIDSVWRDKSLPLAVRLSAAGKAAALRDRSKKKQREEVAVGVESSDRFDMAGPPRLVANRK
jgi:hypothetical protein